MHRCGRLMAQPVCLQLRKYPRVPATYVSGQEATWYLIGKCEAAN